MAKEFGVLPSAVARDLEEDPERLSLLCLPLLCYAEAHAAHKRANKAELKGWKGSQVMSQVQENAFDLAARDMGGEG